MYEMGAWQSAQTEVEIRVARVSSAAIEQIKGFTQDLRFVGQVLQLRVGNVDDLPKVVRCLVEAGAEVFSVVPQRVSLEDLFLQMIGPDPGL
jgi:ABC-2 type transport system ATP-binding protein